MVVVVVIVVVVVVRGWWVVEYMGEVARQAVGEKSETRPKRSRYNDAAALFPPRGL